LEEEAKAVRRGEDIGVLLEWILERSIGGAGHEQLQPRRNRERQLVQSEGGRD
jgi:hypothetical protein